MFPPPNSFRASPQQQVWQPFQSAATSFWQSEHVHEHFKKLKETIEISKAVLNELEEIVLSRNLGNTSAQESDLSSDDHLGRQLSSQSNDSATDRPLQYIELAKTMRISQDAHESLSIEAANSLCSQLQVLLAPITCVTNQAGPWEERSAVVKLAQKLQKSKRNKHWRKRKRKHVAELLQKEREDYDRLDREADEWRAREIAKDIAKRKVESMKQIAKQKANEERKRIESELEFALIVEKLQELRSMRIQKLKKQGHFLPEEDDKYLDQVKAAVEEEERQAATAARTDAAKDAILTAEESGKAACCTNTQENEVEKTKIEPTVEQNQGDTTKSESGTGANEKPEYEEQKVEGKGHGHYDSVANLPFEFYHYYHGSSNDMGTLIEVRRMWDAYIRPGGSRIPRHWVQPPPPADEIWASYLVRPK